MEVTSLETRLSGAPVSTPSRVLQEKMLGNRVGSCDPPGEAGLARDYPAVGGCLDCLIPVFHFFLKHRLICPPARDHLHF